MRDKDKHFHIFQAFQLISTASNPIFAFIRSHGMGPEWLIVRVDDGFNGTIAEGCKDFFDG